MTDDLTIQPAVEENHPHLSISSHVVIQLGLELVSDTEQALLELAKNAYDADSDTCNIIIEPTWAISPEDEAYQLLCPEDSENKLPKTVGRLQIRDEGTGIPAEAVEKGWLRISASLKRARENLTKIKSKKGRTPVGDKGLGRLATMKIGTVLRLKTSLENEEMWRTVTFSWKDFTNDRSLEEVPIIIGTELRNPEEMHGTIIEIIDLDKTMEWHDTKWIERDLVPKLSVLVNPFKQADQFNITLQLGKKIYELQTLPDEVLNLASAKFNFEWDGKKLTSEGWIAPSLFRGTTGADARNLYEQTFSNPESRGLLVSHLKNDKKLIAKNIQTEVSSPWIIYFKNERLYETFPEDKAYPGAQNPGPFKAELHNFLYNDYIKNKLSQIGFSSSQIQSMSGIAIYRDGFRIRAGRDWLRLSGSATSGGYHHLRPDNALGFFTLTNNENPDLIEKSDREGFVDNKPLRGFYLLADACKDFANTTLENVRSSIKDFQKKSTFGTNEPPKPAHVIKKLVTARTSLENEMKHAKSQVGKALENIVATRNALSIQIPNSDSKSNQTINQLTDAAKSVDNISDALNVLNNKLMDYESASKTIELMRDDDLEQNIRLIEAAAVGLSARTISHEVSNYVRQLNEQIGIITDWNKSSQDKIISQSTRKLSSVTRELSKLIATIDPLLPGSRSIKEEIKVHDFISEFIDARIAMSVNEGITLKVENSDSLNELTIKFSHSRFMQIIENLYQNSRYWVKKTAKNSTENLIVVELCDDGFTWWDSGPGITPSIENSIFDPFVSGKPSSEGQGLGLHIVSTFLEVERCNISLMPEKNSIGRKFKFHVFLKPASEAIQSRLIG